MLVCVLVGVESVCVCVCGVTGGFHVPLPPARRLGQTSVKHTHPHTLHLSLSQHLCLLLGYARLCLTHTHTSFS